MAGGAIGVHVEEPEAALAPSKMAVSLPSTQRSKDNQPATTVRSWVAIAVVIEAWLIQLHEPLLVFGDLAEARRVRD
jgi:hypothetical protein